MLTPPDAPGTLPRAVTVTLLLLGGIIGAAGFVVTFLVDGATRRGYDPRYHPVSALALGPRGWLQTANFIVSGTLIAASAVGIALATGGAWLALPIGVFGIALAASGAFPMDPMRGYPPGTAEGTPSTTSRRHRLHDAAGAVVFTALPVAAGIAAVTLESLPWVVYSAVSAAVFFALFLWFGASWEADGRRTGQIQRLTIVTGWTWLALLCWHLLP